MIIEKCTKMIKYLSIIIKIDVGKLTKLFFKKIIIRFNISADIVNDRDSLLINVSDQRFAIMQRLNVD